MRGRRLGYLLEIGIHFARTEPCLHSHKEGAHNFGARPKTTSIRLDDGKRYLSWLFSLALVPGRGFIEDTKQVDEHTSFQWSLLNLSSTISRRLESRKKSLLRTDIHTFYHIIQTLETRLSVLVKRHPARRVWTFTSAIYSRTSQRQDFVHGKSVYIFISLSAAEREMDYVAYCQSSCQGSNKLFQNQGASRYSNHPISALDRL